MKHKFIMPYAYRLSFFLTGKLKKPKDFYGPGIREYCHWHKLPFQIQYSNRRPDGYDTSKY